MKQKKILLAGLIVALLVAGVFVRFLYENRPDDRTRVDSPVGERTGKVVPVLEVVAEGLGQIWGLEFIPNTPQLVATVNSGRLFIINTVSLEIIELDGVMEVDSSGQGGLLDLAVSPEFDKDNTLYLTYSAAGDGGQSTYLARARLDIDTASLREIEEIYVAEPFQSSTSHYGSRVVIDGEYLFMTIGDRGAKNFDDHVSQDRSNVLGTTIRLKRDGSVPADNPFVDTPDVLNEIYSYGHRNVQGMTLHPKTGELWQSEHGERDGDEINIIQAGGNYGWPETHTGCSYVTGQDIGDLPWERDDVVDPVHYWPCNSGGFPPAGLSFYEADGFNQWQGDLFVGGLAGQYLAHFRVIDTELEELEPLLKDEGWRVRDVTVSQHDGAIYVAVEGQDISIVRITPRPIDQ